MAGAERASSVHVICFALPKNESIASAEGASSIHVVCFALPKK
jgi:hypothetical protein